MPAFGTRETAALITEAAQMLALDVEPWELANTEILQLTMEIDDEHMVDLLPKALHPTIPPIIYLTVHRFPDSPAGAFNLAQVRIGCRAGVRPRGFLTAAYVDTQAAADALKAWGFAARVADVALHRYHDRIGMTVRVAGRTVLDAALLTPEPISGGDVQYVSNMNIARVQKDGGEEPLLVQVDPEFTFHRAERGKPVVAVFSGADWNADGVRISYPVSASFALVDTGFPAIRYVVNPDVPALAGSRSVA